MNRLGTVCAGALRGAGQVAQVAQVAVLCLALAAGSGLAASPEFRADCEALVRGPHRLAGTEEGHAAADYVRRRLTEIGADEVLVQEHRVLQTRDLRCELVFSGGEGRSLKLVPMRPNGIIPPVTSPRGVSGPLIHLGAGRAEDYKVESVEGAIVVMDYNSEDRWLRAIRLGAVAVVFVGGQDNAESRHPHSAGINANLLRFYYPGDPADLPAGTNVTIHSEVLWESMTGRNVYGFFRGTAPVFGGQGQEEMIVLAADLDSYGDIPRLSPGARSAANAAALLRVAGDVTRFRPRRHMLVAFFDGEARGLAGVSRLYGALEHEEKSATVDERRRLLDQQRDFVRDVGVLLNTEDPLRGAPGVPYEARQMFLQYLRDKSSEHAFAASDVMVRLRSQREMLRREKKPAHEEGLQGPGSREERIQAITRQLTGESQDNKDRWNDLRRAIEQATRLGGSKQGAGGLSREVRKRLDVVVSEARNDLVLRAKDLGVLEREVTADTALRDRVGNSTIVLHASLMLGDTTPRWGLIIGGDASFRSGEDTPSLYGKIQTAFLRAWRDAAAKGQAPEHFAVGSADQTLSPTRMLWAAPHLIHSGSVAGMCGVFNLVFGTCQERLVREGTPADTLAHLDVDRVEGQADEISRLLLGVADPAAGGGGAALESAAASQSGLSVRQGIRPDRLYKIGSERPTVMGVLPGGSIPNKPVRAAVVQIHRGPSTSLGLGRLPYAYENFLMAMTDSDGRYEIGPAYGSIGFAAVFDERGLAVEVSDQRSRAGVLTRLNVFDCRPGFVVLPPQVRTVLLEGDMVSILSAGPNSLLDPAKSFVELGDGMVNWYCDRKRVSDIKLFGLRQIVALNNGDEELREERAEQSKDPIGVGFPSDPVMPPLRVAQRSAADLWRLNEFRLQVLRSKDIRDSAVEELHGRSEDVLLAAQTEKHPVRREAMAMCSFLASQPVYRSVRATLDDLVFAVLVLLLLAIPFAFVMERVIIGATTIYRQVMWFIVFFLLTFLLLYVTHPAFAIAGTPMIIFLGFAVLVMSVFVIGILMRKFDVELKAIQGIGGTVHTVDVSRMTTLMAAMHMGVSTLRRRPLRTSLTAVTIILLTFTILSFASFGTQKGVLRLQRGPSPSYTGVWLHDLGWAALAPDMAEVIEGRWGRSGTVCRRRWAPAGILSREDGANEMVLRGIVGIAKQELEQRTDLAAQVGTNLVDAILLTKQMALRLGVDTGDTVLVSGLRLRVGRILSAVGMSNLKDMDGGSVLPVDLSLGSGGKTVASEDGTDPSAALQVNWTPLPADSVAVVSEATAGKLGGGICGIAIYTADAEMAGEMADDLARTFVMPVNATLRDGVYFHGLGVLLAASGVRDLFFPILLGGLVIFGTMLGSVADREREIYTFSALGLAPRHVAMLFFAESLVYSLIGGMGGYLLAQGTVKVLTLFAQHGLAVVPEMNVSSTNTIVTILIVMGTVLVSSIYPAVKASRSANPGLMRIWRPPQPDGNVLDLVFPFTVSEYDIAGVVGFLKEHFDSHSETGMGRLLARDVRLTRGEGGALGLDAHLGLAPFDLGVGQSFGLRSVASEIPGIDEVKVRLERVSGQPKDWQRLYKVFLDDLRRQFLLWRSLPQETMERYRLQTLAAMGPQGEVGGRTADVKKADRTSNGQDAASI